MTSKEYIDSIISEVIPALPHDIDENEMRTYNLTAQGNDGNLLEQGEDYFWKRMKEFYPYPKYAVTKGAGPEPNNGYQIKFIVLRYAEEDIPLI